MEHRQPRFYQRKKIIAGLLVLLLLLACGTYVLIFSKRAAMTVQVVVAEDHSDATSFHLEYYVQEGYVGYLLNEDEEYGFVGRTPLEHFPLKFSLWHLITGKPGTRILQSTQMVPGTHASWEFEKGDTVRVAEGEMVLIKTFRTPSNLNGSRETKVYLTVEKIE